MGLVDTAVVGRAGAGVAGVAGHEPVLEREELLVGGPDPVRGPGRLGPAEADVELADGRLEAGRDPPPPGQPELLDMLDRVLTIAVRPDRWDLHRAARDLNPGMASRTKDV